MYEIIDVEAVDVIESEAPKEGNHDERPDKHSPIIGVIKSAFDRTPGVGDWNKLPHDCKEH